MKRFKILSSISNSNCIVCLDTSYTHHRDILATNSFELKDIKHLLNSDIINPYKVPIRFYETGEVLYEFDTVEELYGICPDEFI